MCIFGVKSAAKSTETFISGCEVVAFVGFVCEIS